MDGTLLNFDPAQGAGLIRASDGKRYSFAAGDWRSPETPAPGDVVDFEVDGDRATEVYRIRSGAVGFGKKPVPPAVAPIPPSPADAPAPPPAAEEWVPPPPPGEPGAYLAARPGLVFAGLLLLACFLPFISAGFLSLNLFNLVGVTSMAGNFAYGAGGGVQLGLLLFYLLYAVPIMACWLIFQELRGEASAALRRWTGLVGLAGPFAIIILASLLLQSGARGGPFGRGPRGGGLTSSLLSGMSFGWIMIIVASIALLAVGLGWSPFGKKGEGD
jgi:hypothetical protein